MEADIIEENKSDCDVCGTNLSARTVSAIECEYGKRLGDASGDILDFDRQNGK